MVEIGRVPNQRIAQALADYLKGKQIACQLKPAEQGVIIVVIDDRQAELARQEFTAFAQNPNDPKYSQASWDNGTTEAQIDYGAPSLHLLTQFITGAGPLTLIIFFSCVLVYVGLHYGLTELVFGNLSFFGAMGEINPIEFWRVFTPSLLHFSALHIIFNLLWWWYLGGKIENRLGILPLATLLLVGGTLPNVAQYFFAGPNFGGLSGVVYALVGYTWVLGRQCPHKGIGLPPAYVGFMLIWLVLGFVDALGSSTANAAHLVGLFVGLTQGEFDSRKYRKTKPS